MKKKQSLNRIYHPYWKWEEVKYNMYGKINNKTKKKEIKAVIDYFNDFELVEYFMSQVIEEFKFGCEHNFTNPSMNRVAWLGQASVAKFARIPFEVTMEAWNNLDEDTQNRANELAREKIFEWEQCQKNI